MRPLVVTVALAFAAGTLAGTAVPLNSIACLFSAAVLAVVSTRYTSAIVCSSLIVGVASGSLAAVRQSLECRRVWRPGNHTAILRVQDRPGARGVADARVLFAPEGCGGVVRVRLTGEFIQSGTTLVAVGVVRGRGVFRVDRVRQLRVRRPVRFVVRDAVRARIEVLYGPRAAMVEAMILGRRHDLRDATRDAFVSSGLAHLLAISGLHVGIVATLITLGLRRVVRGAVPLAWAAIVTWMYVFLLGFPVPATRAALFVTIAAWARVRSRNPSLSVVIAVAVIPLVFFEPNAVRSVGAWLSVSAVWSTVRAVQLCEQVDRRRWGRSLPVLRMGAASLGATLITSPITAFAFGNVAPIGVVANLIAVPLTSLAVPAVFLSLVVGGVLAAAAGLLLVALENTALGFQAVPGGHLEGVAGAGFALPWTVVASVAIWLAVRKPVLRLAAWRLLAGLVIIGWISVVLPTLTGLPKQGLLELHMLDVGQGDAIAIKTPNDRWVLVDAGPKTARWDAGSRVVVPFFKRRGVDAVEVAILSHGDADHLGGLAAVLANLETGMVLEPGIPLASHLYVDFLGAVDDGGTRWMPARAGDTLLVDSVRFAVLHPSAQWLNGSPGVNESSLVIHVSYRHFDLLLTGDVGWPAESTLIGSVPWVEVLKVGHHGSRGGTRNAWIEALRPAVALISVGRNNRYGHPSQDVLHRLSTAGVRVFRTDTDGAVTLRSDGRYYELVARTRTSFVERVLCQLPKLLPSSVSSSIRSVCSRKQLGTSRAYFTTSH